MLLFKTATGIAKSVSGKVSGFRGVVSSYSFLLPPQVQMGLKAAELLNGALGGQLKIPTAAQIEARVNSPIAALKKEVLSKADRIQKTVDGIQKTTKTAEEVLNSLDWLF